MDEHSRLLKFIAPTQVSKMAHRGQMRFEYLNPSKIESAVPEQQKLRESVQMSEMAIQKSNSADEQKAERPTDYVMAPVLTVKKEEATFVKGDIKLQKVAVTENLSGIKNGISSTSKSPKYSEIHSEVIQDRQPIRTHPPEVSNKDNMHDRKRTRIPKLRFREAVERVKRERKDSKEANAVQSQARKSSIPRLVAKSATPEKYNNLPKETPDVEFEKIYDEIIDSPVDINVSILNTKVEDPVALENKFEEIIHAYEEDTEQLPTDISKHSKIPKRKSEPDINVTQNIRKYENITNNQTKNNVTKSIKEPISKLRPPSRIGLLKKSISEYGDSDSKKTNQINEPTRTYIPFKRSQSENNDVVTYNKNEKYVSSQPSNVIENKKSVYKIVEEKVPFYKDTIELLPAKEIEEEERKIAKPHSPGQNEVTNRTILVNNQDKALPSNENSQKHEISLETINLEGKETVLAPPEYKTYRHSTDSEDDDDNKSILIGKVSKMIDKLKSKETPKNDLRKDLDSDVSIKKSVHSKIAMFERQKSTDTISKTHSKTFESIYPPKSTDSNETIDNKPLIVEEVLKPIPRVVNNGYNYNNGKGFMMFEENNNTTNDILEIHDIEVSTAEVIDSGDNNNKYVTNDVFNSEDESANIINKKDSKDVAVFYDPSFSLDTTSEHAQSKKNDEIQVNYLNKFSKDTDEKKLEEPPTKSFSATKKVEATDLDRGELVKAKVHAMSIRMNSIERLDVGKTEVISAREKPREKSVFEKIALFEGKFTKVSHQTAPKFRPKDPTPQPEAKETTDTELQNNIEELKNAKKTYGTMDMRYVTLPNGVDMPVLALGTAWLKPPLLEHVISAAIDLGYRAIDTAYIHNNEREVGDAIRKKIQDGTVRREDLFIISKLWSTFHRSELVEKACKASLEAMGLTYFDQYLIHNPMSFKEGPNPYPKIASVLQYSQHDYLDAWFGVERLVTAGLVRSAGVCNFSSEQLHRVLDKAKVKPVVNQVESHPYLTQHKLQAFCSERNVMLVSFGVLGTSDRKDCGIAAVEDPLIQVMAAGLRITPAQLLISYQLHQDRAVVVKASSAARLHENLSSVNVQLKDSELAAVTALNRNKRNFTFKGAGDTHRHFPFKTPF